MSAIASYSIKDLEILTNIKSHTIRIWEKRYGILSPDRSDTNIRRYSNDDLKKLLNVSFLNQHGFKISKIAEMSDLEIRQKVQALNLGNSEENSLIDSLIVAMIELNEAYFLKIFHAATIRLGFEGIVTEVLYPFFGRIGVMWQTGAINPAQEHFVSNIVRQKLIAATDALSYVPRQDLPAVMLLLPENEMHEMALLFYNYALRSRQYPTIYLGQVVPLDSLERIVQITCPQILLACMTNQMDYSSIQEMIKNMAEVFEGNILLTGSALKEYSLPLPANVRIFDRLDGLLAVI
ncbi:MAG: MerR family transcriptional regulator [Sporocytophaga sp.]|nr:MerR family transcriptional regulator [Sporocytophaga sp.]